MVQILGIILVQLSLTKNELLLGFGDLKNGIVNIIISTKLFVFSNSIPN